MSVNTQYCFRKQSSKNNFVTRNVTQNVTQDVTEDVTDIITKDVTKCVTEPVTEGVTKKLSELVTPLVLKCIEQNGYGPVSARALYETAGLPDKTRFAYCCLVALLWGKAGYASTADVASLLNPGEGGRGERRTGLRLAQLVKLGVVERRLRNGKPHWEIVHGPKSKAIPKLDRLIDQANGDRSADQPKRSVKGFKKYLKNNNPKKEKAKVVVLKNSNKKLEALGTHFSKISGTEQIKPEEIPKENLKFLSELIESLGLDICKFAHVGYKQTNRQGGFLDCYETANFGGYAKKGINYFLSETKRRILEKEKKYKEISDNCQERGEGQNSAD